MMKEHGPCFRVKGFLGKKGQLVSMGVQKITHKVICWGVQEQFFMVVQDDACNKVEDVTMTKLICVLSEVDSALSFLLLSMSPALRAFLCAE